MFSASLREGSLNTRLAELAAATIEGDGGTVERASMAQFDGASWSDQCQRAPKPRKGRRIRVCGEHSVAQGEGNLDSFRTAVLVARLELDLVDAAGQGNAKRHRVASCTLVSDEQRSDLARHDT